MPIFLSTYVASDSLAFTVSSFSLACTHRFWIQSGNERFAKRVMVDSFLFFPCFVLIKFCTCIHRPSGFGRSYCTVFQHQLPHYPPHDLLNFCSPFFYITYYPQDTRTSRSFLFTARQLRLEDIQDFRCCNLR